MSSRVHRSPDGILYLTGGSNDVLSLFSPAGFATGVDVGAWRGRLAARAALFAGLGIPWRLVLAPEKLSVLGLDVARILAGPDAMPPAQRLCHLLPHPALVDPAGYLRDQQAAGYRVYMPTDSHWTSLGAFSAFQWTMANMGLQFDHSVYAAQPVIPMRYHGDLWEAGHSDIPVDPFERRSLPQSVTRVHANALVQFKERIGRENDMRLHTGSHVVYRNPAAEHPGRILLFGSSFSDHRAECSLLTYVTTLFFRETHFIWSTSLDIAYLERLAPDVVVFEMPERFLPHCPDDTLENEAHAQTRIAAWGSVATV